MATSVVKKSAFHVIRGRSIPVTAAVQFTSAASSAAT
jgi:hypothetical protein